MQETVEDIINSVAAPVYRGTWEMCVITADGAGNEPTPVPDFFFNPEWAQQAEQMRAPKPTLEQLAQAVVDAKAEQKASFTPQVAHSQSLYNEFASTTKVEPYTAADILRQARATRRLINAETALNDAVRLEKL